MRPRSPEVTMELPPSAVAFCAALTALIPAIDRRQSCGSCSLRRRDYVVGRSATSRSTQRPPVPPGPVQTIDNDVAIDDFNPSRQNQRRLRPRPRSTTLISSRRYGEWTPGCGPRRLFGAALTGGLTYAARAQSRRRDGARPRASASEHHPVTPGQCWH